MFLGMDPSSYLEELDKKPRYYVNGQEVEPLSYMHDKNNVSSLRLRLWLNPFSEKGEPYHGGD